MFTRRRAGVACGRVDGPNFPGWSYGILHRVF